MPTHKHSPKKSIKMTKMKLRYLRNRELIQNLINKHFAHINTIEKPVDIIVIGKPIDTIKVPVEIISTPIIKVAQSSKNLTKFTQRNAKKLKRGDDSLQAVPDSPDTPPPPPTRRNKKHIQTKKERRISKGGRR